MQGEVLIGLARELAAGRRSAARPSFADGRRSGATVGAIASAHGRTGAWRNGLKTARCGLVVYCQVP
jgi:hypothetical protein